MVEAKLLRKKLKNGLIVDKWDLVTIIEKQQNEIEDLKNANRFIQNFAEEQHQRAVALESELDRAVELYTDKAIKVEQLEKELTEAGGMIGVLREQLQEEIQARAEDDKPVAWRIKSKNGEWLYYDEPLVGTEPLYTHSVKELNQNDA